MKIGVDFDDCLNQFMKSFLRWNASSHPDIYRVQIEDMSTYDFYPLLHIGREEAIDRVEAFIQSVCHDLMDPKPDALWAVPTLAKRHELYIITSRSSKYADRTVAWLDNYFGSGLFNEIHFTEQWGGTREKITKAGLCLNLGIELMIDDAPKHIEECADAHIPAVMFDMPYNRGLTLRGVHRVSKWKDVTDYVESYKNGGGNRYVCLAE